MLMANAAYHCKDHHRHLAMYLLLEPMLGYVHMVTLSIESCKPKRYLYFLPSDRQVCVFLHSDAQPATLPYTKKVYYAVFTFTFAFCTKPKT